MRSIFQPTKKTIQSYADDLRNAYDIITGVMQDAEHRYRLGMSEDEYYRALSLKDMPPQELWQSDLADLLGHLRPVEGNIAHLLSDNPSAITRLLRRATGA